MGRENRNRKTKVGKEVGNRKKEAVDRKKVRNK